MTLTLLLFFTVNVFGLCISGDEVVAVVQGQRILLDEIRPPAAESEAKRAALRPADYEQWRTAENRERLRKRIWCELGLVYVKKQHIEPSMKDIKAYAARAGSQVCTPAAALSAEILDESILKKYGGRIVTHGTRQIPIDARRKYLDKTRSSGGVRITDASYADVLADENPSAYTILQLGEENQVRIDCVNGPHVVVRRRSDGRWSEEVRVVAGAERTYSSIEDAASQRCSGDF